MGIYSNFVTRPDDATDHGSWYVLEEICIEIIDEKRTHWTHPERVYKNTILLALFFASG